MKFTIKNYFGNKDLFEQITGLKESLFHSSNIILNDGKYYNGKILKKKRNAISEGNSWNYTFTIEDISLEEHIFLVFRTQYQEEDFGSCTNDIPNFYGIYSTLEKARIKASTIKEHKFDAQFGSRNCKVFILALKEDEDIIEEAILNTYYHHSLSLFWWVGDF